MNSLLHRSFNRDYKKLGQKIKEQFKIKRNLFLSNPYHVSLNNHELHGEYLGYRSINITGDYRAIYSISRDIAVFVRIGTHSELFGE